MANNLISLERAKVNMPSAQSTDENTIDAMIAACSDAIRKYCRRDFGVNSYDELYNGTGDRRLLLRQYPVQSVEAVRYRPVTVLKVINNNTALNQQARVSVNSTGLILTRVASGVRSSDASVTFSANPTLNAVASAVTALGNGWSAQIVGDSGQGSGTGDYGLWPSADLYVKPSYGDGTFSQGGLTARGQFAELKMHTYELAGFQWDPRGWLLRAIPYTDPELLHPEDLIWPIGINNFRVQYTAGYALIPDAIQEACAEWVTDLWFRTQRDPSLLSQSFSGAITQSWGAQTATSLKPPTYIARLLAPYRRYHIDSTLQG
jgi:hypothetical protein